LLLTYFIFKGLTKIEPLLQRAGDNMLSEKDYFKKPVVKNSSSVACALIVTYFFYLFVFHYLSNLPLNEELLFGVQARFWMQPNAIFFLFAGIGFFWFFHLFQKYSSVSWPFELLSLMVTGNKQNIKQNHSSHRRNCKLAIV
jgi:hypothetical protein